MTTDDKIRTAIKVECDRQHVGEDRQEMLHRTYITLRGDVRVNGRVLDHDLICILGKEIEPSNQGIFRRLPASFNGIVGGVSPDNISHAMMLWVEYFNNTRHWMEELKYDDDQKAEVSDHVIKEFLDIHPFSDGNGRTAWLLRVWMLDQWDDPQPLPDYFGE